MKRNVIYFIVILLVIASFASYVIVVKNVPKPNEYQHYFITGQIDISKALVTDSTQLVYVYHVPWDLNLLCRTAPIVVGRIDNQTLSYKVDFDAPIGLNEVLVTTNCLSCNYTVVELKKANLSSNLEGREHCRGQTEPISKESLIKNTRVSLDDIEKELVNKPFNESERSIVKWAIESSRTAITNANSNDVNESLKQAYYARWFNFLALYKSRMIELKNCVQSTEVILESHTSSCFIPDYSAWSDYSLVNGTYHNLWRDVFSEESPRDNTDKIENELQAQQDRANLAYSTLSTCNMAKDIINNTFQFQRSYCEARKAGTEIFKISTAVLWAVVFIYIGIYIRRMPELWKRLKK